MLSRLSLSRKIGLLFGAAIVVLVCVALAVPWVRLEQTIDRSELDTSRQIARIWAETRSVEASGGAVSVARGEGEASRDMVIEAFSVAEWDGVSRTAGAFRGRAYSALEGGGGLEYHEIAREGRTRVYRLAIRLEPESDSGGFEGVVIVERRSARASSQLLVDRIYLVIAGVFAVTLSLVVVYTLMRRVVLSPIRTLRRTAEAVRRGRLHLRLNIRTGDELQELAEAFNEMLQTIEDKQRQLRSMNRTLDMKLTELAERNVALFEANRVKGEFVASVSHELRTPLNSIIGFAEILGDIVEADTEADPGNRQLRRRRRYLENILSAGRSLMEMINELLTMARLEAGTVDVHVSKMSVSETCDALMTLMGPVADRKKIELALDLGRGGDAGELPIIETDPQKLQQVLFNFLSNAVKFTPEGGRVTLRAERVRDALGEERIRFGVLDTGPGIPADQLDAIFQRFHQLQAGVEREHTGTGLGLAIAKEFADLLDATIQVESEVGVGSMFCLIVPMKLSRDASRPASIEELAERRREG